MMFGFGKNKSQVSSTPEKGQPGDEKQAGLFGRLKAGLSKTRSGLTESIANLVVGRKQIDDELIEDLETQLLTADVGVEATQAIIKDLTQRVARKQLNDPDALLAALHDDMQAMLAPVEQPLHIPQSEQPFVLLMVGINGAGKTTSIG
ncbi:MAG: signal recognition particle receptor subunit alpha, partial [Thiogranum sp.]